VKYVVCVPDGCADEPLDELGGRTPLEVADTPVLDSLAARGVVGSAAVIPPGFPPGSDVGNMSILGYNPTAYHTGRAPIEAAAMGLRIDADHVAFRCNLVTVDDTGVMVDFAGGHPDSAVAAEAVAALDRELGGEVTFHAGVQYRHTMVAPIAFASAECMPPHDFTDRVAPRPVGAAASDLDSLMERSREVLAGFDIAANQIWLWGQGRQPDMPLFRHHNGVEAGLVTAVDLVRGLGVLTDMTVATVEGATAWYDTNYEGKRDAALEGLAGGLDLFVIHVEASDEAGHAGDVEEKVRALENWDRRILADLITGLDSMGPWRLMLLPDHATPLALRTHTTEPVPYLMVSSEAAGPGGTYSEAGIADLMPTPGHILMRALVGAAVVST
jgi:2,3-bisphosphoglycerate-independent phosphoglycerate mutase